MDYDVVIVGAGPAGLSFARALGDSGLNIAIVERHSSAVLSNPPVDGREIALTHYSGEILRGLDIWRHIPEPEISLIRRAKVLNGTSPYFLNFDQSQTSEDFLGYLVPNHLIRRAAYQSLADAKNIDLIDGAEVTSVSAGRDCAQIGLGDGRKFSTTLIVAADSRFSQTRQMLGIPARSRDFGRTCIVCRVTHEHAHDDTAYECFHFHRTLAVLPLPGKQSSIVITLPSNQANAVMQMAEDEFSQDTARRFDHRFGSMQLTGKRHAYPLVAVYADRFYGPRSALVGDAAVGMHPVTAHGFNLGLRSAKTLADEINVAVGRNRDIGSGELLARYHRTHNRVARPLYLGTNGIVGLFTDDRRPARLLRRSLVRLGNHVPLARRVILNQLTEIPSLTR